MDDLTGKTINGFEFRELLGAGGFGHVYRAYELALRREVAVKIILPAYLAEARIARRFEEEARLIAQLEHPHLVPIFSRWQDDQGHRYIVMRLLRGGSLRDWLKQGALSLEFIARIVNQITGALDVLHQRRVIHRDIKPENILLDEQYNAYLSDLGIAKDLNAGQIITTGDKPGSLPYTAREYWLGSADAPQGDLYSLAIVVYECLTGKHPFPNSEQIFLAAALPPLSVHRAALPGELDIVLQRATHAVPQERYANVLDFAKAFQAALSSTTTGITAAAARRQPLAETLPASIEPLSDTLQALPDMATVSPLPEGESEISHHPGAAEAFKISRVEDIPFLPGQFIGREDILRRIQTALEQSSPVLLQGFAGIGKTALAARFCEHFLNSQPGTILWLHAGTQPVERLIEALVRPFDGQNALSGKSGEQQARALRDILRDKQVALVVLDDIWSAGAAFLKLVQALPQKLPVLATSRERYPRCVLIELDRLSETEGLALLSQHAQQPFTAEDEDAKALCRLLGYHPFALEVAGQSLLVDMLTPGELYQRIQSAPHEHHLPPEYVRAGAQSVKELLDDSFYALDDRARAVFLASGALFAPEVTPPLMALLLETEVEVITPLLDSLARRGLAHKERSGTQSRYRLHDLAFSYCAANTWLEQDRVVNACREFVQQQLKHFDALDMERTNIYHAAAAAGQAGDSDTLVDIVKALAVDSRYFEARGYTLQVIELLKAAIDVAKANGQIETAHYLLSKLGNACGIFRSELEAAFEYYTEALHLARQMKNSHREIVMLTLLGTTRARQKQPDADVYYEQANQIARAAGDDDALSMLLEHRGHQALEKHDFSAAHDFFAQSLEVAERLQDSQRLFFALINLSTIKKDRGLHEAIRLAERALKIGQEEDNSMWLSSSQEVLGELHHAFHPRQNARAREKAQTLFNQALAGFEAGGHLSMLKDLIRFMHVHHYEIPEQYLIYLQEQST